MSVRLHVVVSGMVQGVGFRDWVRRTARPLELAGSAVNLPDGRVEVIAEGAREACEQLLARLGGWTPGEVSDLEVSWPEPQSEPAGFRTG